MTEKNNENLTIIPPDTPKIHATVGASFITPFNIRLLLFNDEIVRNGEVLAEGETLPAIREAKCELILHPNVAESIGNLLLKEVEKYKKEFYEQGKDKADE